MGISELSAEQAVAVYCGHLAEAIRTACQIQRRQQKASTSHHRARSISERITKSDTDAVVKKQAHKPASTTVIVHIQDLADCMSNAGWLCADDLHERFKAVEHHSRLFTSMCKRMHDEDKQRYRLNETFCNRCLAVVARSCGSRD